MPTERDAPRCETCGKPEFAVCMERHDPPIFLHSGGDCPDHHEFVAARPPVEGPRWAFGGITTPEELMWVDEMVQRFRAMTEPPVVDQVAYWDGLKTLLDRALEVAADGEPLKAEEMVAKCLDELRAESSRQSARPPVEGLREAAAHWCHEAGVQEARAEAAEAERDRLREVLEATYEREAREHHEQWKRDIEDAALGEDELSRYDNRTMDCPACGQRGVSCERCDGDVHDACLRHIEGATSACCGHGIGLGHIDIGGYMARAARTEGEGGSDDR